MGSFTLYFDGQFWVGLATRESGGVGEVVPLRLISLVKSEAVAKKTLTAMLRAPTCPSFTTAFAWLDRKQNNRQTQLLAAHGHRG